VNPEQRLRDLGLEIPPVPSAVANYVGAVRVENLLFVSGHGPVKDGKNTFIGKLGRDLEIEQGREAAQLVALNMLATIKEAVGDLDLVERAVKLLVMVNSMPDFQDQPQVANGASDLLVGVFGEERGKHARSAVGMGALPFGISVEIEGIFQVKG
jgi:enamine deaminase RidA (YjgF/YER057c/UK114 family)